MENRKIKDSWSKIKPDNATHERILNNILERKYSGETKKGKVYDMAIKPMRILAPIAACLIVALAISIPIVPRQAGAPILPSIDTARLSAIHINELSEITTARLAIDLRPEDFAPMSKDEMIDFYGFDFFPSAIPVDIQIVEESAYGIYKRDEGTGAVYYSANLAWYMDDNVNRQLQVTIDKGNLPHSCFAYLGAAYEKSVINGTELLIGRSVDHSGTERFVAEMMYAGNGIRIESSSLTQAEFVDTVTSLIQGVD